MPAERTEALVELASQKTPFGSRALLRDRPAIQAQVAQAEVLVRSARAFLFSILQEAWDAAASGRPASAERRAVLRSAALHAAISAAQAVDLMYNAGGGRCHCIDVNCSDRPEENRGPLAALLDGSSLLDCLTSNPINNLYEARSWVEEIAAPGQGTRTSHHTGTFDLVRPSSRWRMPANGVNMECPWRSWTPTSLTT